MRMKTIFILIVQKKADTFMSIPGMKTNMEVSIITEQADVQT